MSHTCMEKDIQNIGDVRGWTKGNKFFRAYLLYAVFQRNDKQMFNISKISKGGGLNSKL